MFVLLSFVRRTEKSFLMSGVLGRRRGPDDYVLFPNEKGEDEGSDQEVLGVFCRVSFLLFGCRLVRLNWNSQRDMAKTRTQVEPKEAAESQRCHR